MNLILPLIAATAMLSLAMPPASAAFIETIAQVGDNVVAIGSGTIDTSDLGTAQSVFLSATIYPSVGYVNIGPVSDGFAQFYEGASGPTSIGSTAHDEVPSSGAGNYVGINGGYTQITVPVGYVSGAPLAATSTWDDATFASLGLDQGTYQYTFGSGADADSFTVEIGSTAIPEPAALAVFGTAAILLPLRRRGRRGRPAV